MKQKCSKTIVIKIVTVIFAVFFSLFVDVFAQYYYFSSGGNSYQQGCNEVLQVRVDSEGQKVRAGRFHLLLDPLTTIYPQIDDVAELRQFFSASTDTFINWTSEGSPSWKGESNYTILRIDRNNGTSDYSGKDKLYGNVNFKPVFSGSVYDIVFGMEYISGDSTSETTLSFAGGKELINPEHQDLYRTGTFVVLQEPCVADTTNPTIPSISIANDSTKVSYLSGLTFSLKDEGGLNGLSNVPYVWSGGEWTGNIGGIISNQYGIDQSGGTITFMKNSQQVKVISLDDEGVSLTWNKKTWQDTGLNLDVSISSGLLFDFGIEKEMSLNIRVYDRAGNLGVKTVKFNKPKGPMLIPNSLSPKDADIYVNLSEPIKLGIKDDWAGVNSGTISIILSGVDGTEYGPYAFLDDGLNLSEVVGEANTPDYYVNINNHEIFPTSGTIRVSVYAEDMEGNVDEISDYTFTTRPNCTDFQCCEPVLLDLGNGGNIYYYNTGLIISGGNNPTFFVDAGDGIGVIDCNVEEEGLSVYEGNDFVFFTDDNEITISGTGIKGILSGDVLILSYMVESSQIIIDKPVDSEFLSGGDVEILWHLTGVENEDTWLSGYVVQIYSGEDLVTGGFVGGTGIIENLSDGEYDVVIYPVDLRGHTGNQVLLSFVVDTVAPACSIEIITQECTNSGVEIKLSGDSSDIVKYNWRDGTSGDFSDNVVINVYENGQYTGYVYDLAGNQGICEGVVGPYIQDQSPISYEIHDAVGYECELITGYVQIFTGDSCGKDENDKFGYLWNGGLTTAEYGILADNVSGYNAEVTITDGVGNTVLSPVSYTWQDTGVTLISGENQNIGYITGSYTITVGNLVDLFDATEGACGKSQITVSGVNCSGATMSINAGIIEIIPNGDLDGVDGYCKLEFGDDEGEKTAIGTLGFIIDTVAPGLILQGTNEACMSTNTFNVTGVFTEFVQGFELLDIDMENGSASNFGGNGLEYTWQVEMDSMVEVIVNVPAGVATDLNGIENTASNTLTGVYDNVGPNSVSLVQFGDTVYAQSITLSWNTTIDNGCAGMSGYNWEIYEGSCGGGNKISEGFIESGNLLSANVDGLVNNGNYCWRVQPVDNFGNKGEWSSSTFVVDLSNVGCMIIPVEGTQCTSGEIQVQLLADDDYMENGPIYLSWVSTGDYSNTGVLYTGITYSGQHILGYISQPATNKSNVCYYTATNIIDQITPSIVELNTVITVPECTTGTAEVFAIDEGCGDNPLMYKWDGNTIFGNDAQYSLWSGGLGSKEVNVQVMDNVGNTIGSSVVFEWINSNIFAYDIVGIDSTGNAGKFVNWKEESEATDGECGNEMLEVYMIYQGAHGICSTGEDDIIIYTPNTGEQFEGSDMCTIRIKDDEDDWIDILVLWEGVDTKKPSCNLVVQDPQQCSSGNVVLTISSEDSDVMYSFDGENFGNNTTTTVDALGVYTGYVKDIAGNVGICTGIVSTENLDLDDPILLVSDWIGDECSTGSITVVGNDVSCGINGLLYDWIGIGNNSDTNSIYSENVGSQTVDITVYDGVGHSITKQVTYIWQNVEVTGTSFTVENVGNGTIVDWFASGNISAGSCELDDIVATTDNNEICEINGHDIIYTPSEGFQGGETCTIVITDGDGGEGTGIEITVTFTGVDAQNPTVELQGGVGEQCTSENIFTVTGIFSKEVIGVSGNTLVGENVNVVDFTGNGDRYEWTVEMLGGLGKVWVNTGEVVDLVGNVNKGSNTLILGNYDNIGPNAVNLILPLSGYTFTGRNIQFEWSGSSDEGCAGFSGYRLLICRDLGCTDVVEDEFTVDTGKIFVLSENGDYYWVVNPVDSNGNIGIGITGHFAVNSMAPSCFISQSDCSTGAVTLILTGNIEVSIISGNVSWYQLSETAYTYQLSENIEVWAVVQDADNQTGYCHLYVSNFDNVEPTFTFYDNSGEECKPGSMKIRDATDNLGCAGLAETPYKFNTGDWGTSTNYIINPQQLGTIVVTGYVRDGLGNWGWKTATYTFIDVVPSISGNGVIDGVYSGEFVVNVVEQLGVSEGACGTGDLIVKLLSCDNLTGNVVGHILAVDIDDDIKGTGYCIVEILDNEGSSVTGKIEFMVDTELPNCTGWYSIPSGWTSGESVMVYLTGCNETIFGDTGHLFTKNTGYLFEYSDNAGNTGSLYVEYTGFDYEFPIFEMYVNSATVYECQTGFVIISGAVDTGIGLAENPYSFDGLNRSAENTVEIVSNTVTGIFVSGYVRDGLGNLGASGVLLNFEDSKPSATGFIVYALNGVDVNWKELSNAADGMCGTGTLYATVTGGIIGTCSISGDILSYRPNDDYVTGSDNCELTIYDDEGNYITGINTEFTGINKYPYVKLISPQNGEIKTPGIISFSWTGIGDESAISGFVYRIWNTIYDRTGELTGFELSLDLGDGAYNWYVYVVFTDGTTGGLSTEQSFNIIKVSSGGGGGGHGHRLTRDKCPNGDYSDSYYDGTCEAAGGESGGTHGSAGSDVCGVNVSYYSTEQKFAYLYSYMYGITTVCPIQDANLNGYLLRSHFAKMISKFAVNVLGMKPERGKEGCDKFNDVGKLSAELRSFVTMSCELGLMGLDADGVTPSKSFNPDSYVTRAQFGTVLSRLLFGEFYNIKDGETMLWYQKHLQALKDYGIMTKIDGDWPSNLEKRGRVMIMLQRADNYGIFAGKIPAKNGVTALFDE